MQAHDTDRIKIDDQTWSVKCVQCGEYFEASRSDASFCSTKHRVAYSKEPQKLENALQYLEDQIYHLEQMAEKYRHNDRVFEKMVKLQKRMNGIVAIFEK